MLDQWETLPPIPALPAHLAHDRFPDSKLATFRQEKGGCGYFFIELVKAGVRARVCVCACVRVCVHVCVRAERNLGLTERFALNSLKKPGKGK